MFFPQREFSQKVISRTERERGRTTNEDNAGKVIYNDNPRKKSLEGQSAEKKGQMDAMFDFIRTEMDL